MPDLSWILFLRILDEREGIEAEEAAALGIRFAPSLEAPFRWRDWAAPGVGSRPGATWAIPGMLPRYVFDRRSGQRHGLPAAIPIHPAP